jgi:hypothetical protein
MENVKWFHFDPLARAASTPAMPFSRNHASVGVSDPVTKEFSDSGVRCYPAPIAAKMVQRRIDS